MIDNEILALSCDEEKRIVPASKGHARFARASGLCKKRIVFAMSTR
jgi:hypothetical protein